jgi:type II secretory pathway component PulF
MFLRPQLSNKALTELCHRLAIETEAGIDIRRTWQREAESSPARFRSSFVHVRDAVARGESLSVALAGTGSMFPPLLLEMVHVGEQTGTLGRVFHRLSSHYRHQVEAQRIFLSAIAWPMLELALAIVVVGALILILGVIARRGQEPVDILGFGLVGTRGLVLYVNFIVAVGICILGVVIAVRRGVLWTRPLERALLHLPGVGPALEKVYLSRLAWAMHLTLNVAMDFRRLVPLVLRATGNDYYIRHTNRITQAVASGQPLHVAFAATGAFPATFIDALAVAEESGELVESLDRLSKRYEDEAEAAVKTLATIFGFLVALFVMGLIAVMIFRIAGFYLGTLNKAIEMTR